MGQRKICYKLKAMQASYDHDILDAQNTVSAKLNKMKDSLTPSLSE
jgi:hypothetical protein